MTHDSAPLPAWLVDPSISARTWLAVAGGLGCAVTAYAGLYPQFDQGELRHVLALTSAPFGAAVIAAALSAKTAARAFGRTVFLAGLLGTASTIVPAALLARSHGGEFAMMAVFGVFFGAPTGMMYGLPLGVLAALGHRHVQTPTHAANDGAGRVAGTWLGAAGMVALLGVAALGGPLLPTIGALAAAFAGFVLLVRATLRQSRRAAWVARVRGGDEPDLRVRPIDRRDPVALLPRLALGNSVVEWCPTVPETSAYRQHPVLGTAVAVVADQA
jgi:hypothetical protein